MEVKRNRWKKQQMEGKADAIKTVAIDPLVANPRKHFYRRGSLSVGKGTAGGTKGARPVLHRLLCFWKDRAYIFLAKPDLCSFLLVFCRILIS